jgi:O-antigen/teichoic acid export membrane protein
MRAVMLTPRLKTLIYVFFMGGASVLSFVKPLLYADLLSVEHFGLYCLVILTATFLSYFVSSGVDSSFLREAAFLSGEGEVDKLETFKNETFSGALFISVVSFFIILSLLFCVRLLFDFNNVFFLLAPLSCLIFLFNLYLTFFRISGHISLFSIFLFLKVLIAVVIGYALLKDYSLIGVVFSEVFTMCILLLIVSRKIALDVSFPEIKPYVTLMMKGYGFSMSALVQYLTLNVDKWCLMFFLGAFALGQYSFYFIVFSGFLALANIINQILVPKWLSEFGKTKSRQYLWRNLFEYFIYSSLVGLLLGVITCFVMYYLTREVYPQYFDYKYLLIIVVASSIFHITNLFEVYYLACELGKEILVFKFYVLLFVSFLCLFFGTFSYSVFYFGLAFLLGRALNLFLVFRGAFKHLGRCS